MPTIGDTIREFRSFRADHWLLSSERLNALAVGGEPNQDDWFGLLEEAKRYGWLCTDGTGGYVELPGPADGLSLPIALAQHLIARRIADQAKK